MIDRPGKSALREAELSSSQSNPQPGSLGERVRALRLPTESPRRRVGPLAWFCGLVVVGGAAAGYYFWTANHPEAKSSEVAASAEHPEQQTTAPVTPALAVASGEGTTLEATGYIIPAHQILVSPKISGMIVKLDIEEGKRVPKGFVLAELESTDYQSDVDRAIAARAQAQQRLLELRNGNRPEEISAAKAELAEAEAQRDQLLSDWRRNINLRGSKALTERDYEQAESAYKAMDRRVARLKSSHELMVAGPRAERIAAAVAEVDQAKAELAKSQWRLDNCKIVAPITGTILKKNAEEGNIVNPIAFNGSYSVCDMADLSDLEVDLNIPERDVARVFKGQKCKVRPEAYRDRSYDGVVSRLMPIADRAKGAVPVRVKLSVPAEEEGVYLKPEMSAVVSFLKAST